MVKDINGNIVDNSQLIATGMTIELVSRENNLVEISEKVYVPRSENIYATVGQTIAVTEVDENGKPTAWEAVDPWVMTSSAEGSTKQFKLTIDDTGTLTIAEIVEEVE